MEKVLNVLMTHQTPASVGAMIAWWQERIEVSPENLLIAHGGLRDSFDSIEHPHKVFVDDPRLRVRDHQREFQSYHGVFRDVAHWLHAHEHAYVYFAEYDHVPLAPRLNTLQVEAISRERADVLGLGVERIDGTSHPHYLYAAHNPGFHHFWAELSRRSDPKVILTMLGTGSFWTRSAFVAVAEAPESLPIYTEIYLPTAAHHLGCRVRPYPDRNAQIYVHHIGDLSTQIEEASNAGAWTIHPIKTLWTPAHAVARARE